MKKVFQTKPTFFEIKCKHGADLKVIFEASGLRWTGNLRHNVLYRMISQWLVHRAEAQRVMDNFNKLCNTNYKLDELHVPLYPDVTPEGVLMQLSALNAARIVVYTASSRALSVKASERIDELFFWFEEHGVDVAFDKASATYRLKSSR